jgi:UDP-N-acetylglucosamine acyltransferase
MSNIHPTAIVEKGAQIGESVTIGPFAYIGDNVTIDEGTVVGAHTVIEGRTRIGKNNRIFSHAAIGTIPQDLKYAGEPSELIIGDDNIIREFTLFNPGTEGGGMVTRIGNGNLFMGYVHLGHDVVIGNGCILANAATLAGHVELGDHVVIGGLTPVHQFVHIGDYAMIGGASAVAQDIPPYCLAEGNRATVRGLNLTGLRRKFERNVIDELKRAYRELFEKGQPIREVAERLYEDDSMSQHVKKLCAFILSSKRGIPFKRK